MLLGFSFDYMKKLTQETTLIFSTFNLTLIILIILTTIIHALTINCYIIHSRFEKDQYN